MTSERVDDETLEALGCDQQITHVFNVLTEQALDCSVRLLGAVARSGALLRGLHMTPRGAALEHRLELQGLKASQARRLSDALAGLQGVRFANVEHRLGRERS